MALLGQVLPYSDERFDNYVLDCGCVGFEDPPIPLSNPRFGEPVLSPFYIQMRKLSATVYRLLHTAEFVESFCNEKSIKGDCYLGVPDGATKLAVTANVLYRDAGAKVPLSRRVPKSHGAPQDRNYITPVEKGDKVIVLEDVNVIGDGLIAEVKKILECGAEPVAVTMVNRLERRDDGATVVDVMKAVGVPYHCMSDTKRLLPLGFKKLDESKKPFFARKVDDYYKIYGAIEMVLVP